MALKLPLFLHKTPETYFIISKHRKIVGLVITCLNSITDLSERDKSKSVKTINICKGTVLLNTSLLYSSFYVIHVQYITVIEDKDILLHMIFYDYDSTIHPTYH